jgi:hypothetical protein
MDTELLKAILHDLKGASSPMVLGKGGVSLLGHVNFLVQSIRPMCISTSLACCLAIAHIPDPGYCGSSPGRAHTAVSSRFHRRVYQALEEEVNDSVQDLVRRYKETSDVD